MLFIKHIVTELARKTIYDLYNQGNKNAIDVITIKILYDYNLKFRFKTLNLLLDVSKISSLTESNQVNNALGFIISKYVIDTSEFAEMFNYKDINKSISGILQVVNKANLASRVNTDIISIKLPRLVIKVIEDYVNTNKTFTLNTAIWLILYKNLIA